MKYIKYYLLLGAVVVSAPIHATIIYDNGQADDEFLVEGWVSDSSFPQEIGDDFSLSTTSVINGIQWWGGYFENARTSPDNFTIGIFELHGGVPGQIPLFLHNVGDVSVDFSRGLPTHGGWSEYLYTSPINEVTLDPGDYLLSIVNETSAADLLWYWHTSSTSGSSWERTSGSAAWTGLGDEFAFNLRGIEVSEPGVFVLFLIGIASLYLVRRRDRRRLWLLEKQCLPGRQVQIVKLVN